ncbi:MAG: hypothetical protein ACOCP8_05055 [archaeon]
MKIPYKKLDLILKKIHNKTIEIDELNKEFDTIIRNKFGDKIGEKIITDTEFIDSIMAYANNGEHQGIYTLIYKLDEVIKKLDKEEKK